MAPQQLQEAAVKLQVAAAALGLHAGLQAAAGKALTGLPSPRTAAGAQQAQQAQRARKLWEAAEAAALKRPAVDYVWELAGLLAARWSQQASGKPLAQPAYGSWS